MPLKQHRLANLFWFLLRSLALVFPLLFCFCETGPTLTQTSDPIEFESVWQYLKVYSIYQERLPEHAFIFETPSLLLQSLNDTIKNCTVHYTKYLDGFGYALYTASGKAGQSGSDIIFDELTDKTCQIAIKEFTTGSVHQEFLSCIGKAAPYPNVIVDLRRNGGGDLDELTAIVDEFLPAGKEYIMARERSYNRETREAVTLEWHPWTTQSPAHTALRNKRFLVRVNHMTASASEILAAALNECASALLVGQKTYGKGIGQIKLPRRGRQGLQITYLQLKGMSERIGDYHQSGIEPDSLLAPGQDEETELTAIVKMLEPNFTGTIKYPLRRTLSTASEEGAYRIIDEEILQSP